jgi:hypothetical protein
MIDIDISDQDFEQLKQGKMITLNTNQDLRSFGESVMVGTDEQNCVKAIVVSSILLLWNKRYIVQLQGS